MMATLASRTMGMLALLSATVQRHGAALAAERVAGRESSEPALIDPPLGAGAAPGFLEYRADTGQFTGTSLLDVIREDSPRPPGCYAQAAPGPRSGSPTR
jgi:hypothetical protein